MTVIHLESPATSFKLAVASKVRGRMAEQNRTQTELAGVLGITQQSVSRKLRGITPLDVEELAVICDWLKLSVVELLGDAGHWPSDRGLVTNGYHGSELELVAA